MRRCVVACSRVHPFRMQHRQRYYIEEMHNDYDMHHYLHPRELRRWYAKTEVAVALGLLDSLQISESKNNHNGLHWNGDGPMERELVRKGVPVDKYELPTTVAVNRVHEAVLLRRAELERRATEAMSRQRAAKKVARPTSWFDETDGPLNPHFLRFAQSSYEEPITELPRTPLRYSHALPERSASAASSS